MLSLMLLVSFFQAPEYNRQVEDLRRLAELKHQSEFRLAEQKDKEYRVTVLHEDHKDFVVKFNAYLLKYHRGEIAVKEIRECVRAWEKLRKNPDSGFNASH